MASPLVQRQLIPLPSGTTTSRASPSTTSPPPTTPTTTTSTTANGLLPSVTGVVSSVTSLLGPAFSTSGTQPPPSTPAPPSSITPSSPVSSVSPATNLPLSTTGSEGPVTITQTTSATAPPPGGSSESKGKTFLENKPLSGFVFGLAGLVVLILVFIVVTSIVRRRNRKRLLADASNFSFDPRDVEDGTSDEKHSHSGLVGQHHSGHSHSDYPPDSRAAVGFVGVGIGSTSRPGPARPPPTPAYIPQDYVGYDVGHPVQYRNLGNVLVGYNPTPNAYDMYDPRNGRRYSNNQGQHDPYTLPESNGDNLAMTNRSLSVPHQLQPGVRPTQGPAFRPHPPNNGPPPLNSSPPLSSTISPPPSFLQPSASDHKDLPRLPTPGPLPDTFGQRKSDEDVDDDAYGGASLGPDSPPEQRTLHVANM